jgi:ParB/RepB/Spo0J family partition protein
MTTIDQTVLLPLARVHPDPNQPRLEPDADLADSIRSQGVLQAIRVEPLQPIDAICDHCGKTFIGLAAESGHYMIQDGERRFRGSLAAKRPDILARIVEPVPEGQRLLHQLTANTGKALTVVEEAFAMKRIMDAEGWSQNELAKQLGRPRSVVGDRIRLVELHQVWLDLIQKGTLQASHAATLSHYSAVPDEYQVKAAANIKDDYHIGRAIESGESVPIEEFEAGIRQCFRDYIKPMSEVKGYKGPTIEVKEHSWHSQKTKFAVDPTIWRPIFNKRQRELKKKRKSQGGTSYHQQNKEMKKLLELDLEKRDSSDYYVQPKNGEFKVYDQSGWAEGIDPVTFLSKVDRAKLTLVKAKYQPAVVTTDVAAIEAAQLVYQAGFAKKMEPEMRAFRKQLESVMGKYTVKGPGTRRLLAEAGRNDYNGVLASVALALSLGHVDGDEDDDGYDDQPRPDAFPGLSDDEVESLAAGFAAATTEQSVEVPDTRVAKNRYHYQFQNLPFDFNAGTGKKKRGRPSKAEVAAREAREQIAEATA